MWQENEYVTELKGKLTFKTIEKAFKYLEQVRESGAINMLASTPLLQSKFGFGGDVNKQILTAWIETFEERHKTDE
ncbi:MAG: hypothetical protein ACRC0V_12200 [Fusobacteriaceae bacterium]